MSVADRIRQLRGAKTQKNFAEAIGVNANTLRAYEKGRTSPSADAISAICTKIDVTPDWLLFGNGPMRRGGPRAEDQGEARQTASQCPHCRELEAELKTANEDLRKEREMSRELVAENRELWKENGKLKEKLADLKARAAPDRQIDPAVQKSA